MSLEIFFFSVLITVSKTSKFSLFRKAYEIIVSIDLVKIGNLSENALFVPTWRGPVALPCHEHLGYGNTSLKLTSCSKMADNLRGTSFYCSLLFRICVYHSTSLMRWSTQWALSVCRTKEKHWWWIGTLKQEQTFYVPQVSFMHNMSISFFVFTILNSKHYIKNTSESRNISYVNFFKKYSYGFCFSWLLNTPFFTFYLSPMPHLFPLLRHQPLISQRPILRKHKYTNVLVFFFP